MLLGPAENLLAKSIAAYTGLREVNLLQVSIVAFKASCFVIVGHSNYGVILDKTIYFHNTAEEYKWVQVH